MEIDGIPNFSDGFYTEEQRRKNVANYVPKTEEQRCITKKFGYSLFLIFLAVILACFGVGQYTYNGSLAENATSIILWTISSVFGFITLLIWLIKCNGVRC